MEELINQFKNGLERYQTNALFNKCIQCLYRGDNPLKVLDDVLKIQENTLKQYEYVLKVSSIPIIIPKELE